MTIRQNDSSNNFIFQVQLTDRCNLQCQHCYVENNGTDIDPSKLTHWLTEAASVLRRDFGFHGYDTSITCNLAGGEPMLYKDLGYVVQELHRQGIKCYLLSNGTIPPTFFDEFTSFIDGVQISLDGMQECNDKIRGSGSFDAAVTSIKHLLDIDKLYSVSCTISTESKNNIRDFLQFCSNIGVTKVGIKRYIPQSNVDQLDLTRSEFHKVLESIRGFSNVKMDDPIADLSLSSCDSGGCSVGFFGLCINSNGDLLPCSKLKIKIGNINTCTFEEVWYGSETLSRFRNKGNYKICTDCHRWSKCRGCRAYAYAKHGDPFSHDDYCCL